MKRSVQILMQIYTRLLSLYPQQYRAKYGEELQAVFSLLVNEAAQRGRFSVIRLGWREMRDMPGAVIREHRRERRKRKMETKTSVLPAFEPGSWREWLAAMALFLLLALTSLLSYLHIALPLWVSWGLFLVPLLMFALGLIKGLPRWFLPYTGVIGLQLSWVFARRGTMMGINTRAGVVGSLLRWTDRQFFEVLRPSASDPWIVRAVYGAGELWFVLLGMAAFAVLIAAACRPLRPFYWRLRDDWTLLSFGLYGATVMAVNMAFEDYPHPHKQLYIFVASLILVAGAWVYLRSAHLWQRSLALFGGITLSMAVAATGRAILYANPLLWPRAAPRSFTWQSEVLSTVFGWGLLVAVIMAPALLRLLPRPAKPLQVG
jgi:hypothetical protein